MPVDHPSCSKQHAVIQYRLVDYTKADGSAGRRVRYTCMTECNRFTLSIMCHRYIVYVHVHEDTCIPENFQGGKLLWISWVKTNVSGHGKEMYMRGGVNPQKLYPQK